MRSVAFLGPAGTFTEEALLASAEDEVEAVPYATVYETVMAVQDGHVEGAVVPIENSIEGSVHATLDALAGEARDVRIAREVVRPVQHCLIAARQLEPAQVERVLSHPQALAQCARFLRERLPGAERASAPSTADAVRIVAEHGGEWGALAPRLAAELYDCRVLLEGVEDESGNSTRFVWLAPANADPEPGAAKTSIVFWGFNDDSPGALVAVLGEFAEREINLTKIESRPLRGRLGHYMFFADLEGGIEAPEVENALEGLRSRVEQLRVLGSYPVD